MPEQSKDLHKLFKEASENFQMIPSVEVWNNIERQIIRRKRKKFIIIYFVLFTAFVSTGILLITSHHSNLVNTSVNSIPQVEDKNNVIQEYKQTPKRIIDGKTKGYDDLRQHRDAEIKAYRLNDEKKMTNSPLNNIEANNLDPGLDEIRPMPEESLFEPDFKEIFLEKHLDKVDLFDAGIKHLKLKLPEVSIGDSVIQESNQTPKAVDKKIILKYSFSLSGALQIATLNEPGDYQYVANYRNNTDNFRKTIQPKITVSYSFNPVLSVFAGISLIGVSQKSVNHQVVYKIDTIPSTGPVPAPSITISKNYFDIQNDSAGSFVSRYQWINIPVGFEYALLKKGKFSMALRTELGVGKLIHYSGYAYDEHLMEYKKMSGEQLRPWQVCLGGGLGLVYYVSNKISLGIYPAYRKSVNSIFSNDYLLSMPIEQLEVGVVVGIFP